MKQLLDQIGRKIDYLRISITDRCNLRCQYCMPSEGVEYKFHDNILRYEEIIQIVKVGVELGIKKVRITGGEPLVRGGVVDFIRHLNEVKGLEDISLTTNGILLGKYAEDLKDAGLNRVNISLDTLDRDKFKMITRRDNFDQALEGIKTALKVGLTPVKVNTVMMKGVNDDEILDFVNLSHNNPIHVRFIEFMPLGQSKELSAARYISLEDIRNQIMKEIELIPAMVKSSGPATTYKVPSGQGTIGFITPISHNFCSTCNRLRLTSDGRLRPCLDSNLEIDLHDENGKIIDVNDIKDKFIKAIMLKPGHHNFLEERGESSRRDMFQIGG
ncbi:MAG: GTP 3',8-cyclase MoaA [Halanaerobiales bacterium]|nr:GTP 3',8-cyclase MoaA [Halanaerobiales bacterium]